MRRAILWMTVVLLCAASASSQATRLQTARQALLEMFFSKEPGTFVKHLPAATRAALEKAGALSNLQQYSAMMAQLQAQGKGLQTYESGSILLVAENPADGQKVQITVEKDAMRGDRDDIELSFLIYKSGQAERTPFMPQLTFSMKQEEQIWKLNEISITIHVPLADADFLKAVTEKMTPATQPRPTITLTSSPQSETPVQSGASDATVLAAMHTILAAEATYASSYPNVGYTCSLSSLDGFGGGEPNEHQAMLINSGLASGKKYGFVFTISGCSSAPATSFHLTAAPNANTLGRKAFCADQSGVIRSAQDGSPATCWASGSVAQ